MVEDEVVDGAVVDGTAEDVELDVVEGIEVVDVVEGVTVSMTVVGSTGLADAVTVAYIVSAAAAADVEESELPSTSTMEYGRALAVMAKHDTVAIAAD